MLSVIKWTLCQKAVFVSVAFLVSSFSFWGRYGEIVEGKSAASQKHKWVILDSWGFLEAFLVKLDIIHP